MHFRTKTVSVTFFLLTVFALLCSQSSFAWYVRSSFDGNPEDADIFSNKISNDFSFSGSNSIKFFIQGGAESTGQHQYNLPNDLHEGDEFWIRIYIFPPAGFDWTCSPITKLLRITTARSDGSDSGYHSILATRPQNYGCSGENKYGYMVTGSEMNSSKSPPPICQNKNADIGDSFLTPGEWHCMELYIKVSENNGIIRAWHNGILKQEYFYPTITAGGYIPANRTTNWTVHHLLGWWNGGPTKDQYLYFDNMAYTNETPQNRDAEGNYMIGPVNYQQDGGSGDDQLTLARVRGVLILNKIDIVGVQASSDDGNVPENTMDENFSTRWSAEGDGQWIEYDFGEEKVVSFILIGFYLGDQRTASFNIQTSKDKSSWTDVFEGSSSGNRINLEKFEILSKPTARYLRIIGHGNSTSMWNSITEVEIYSK